MTIRRLITIGILLGPLFLFMSCSEKKEDTDVKKIKEYRVYIDSLYKNYEKKVITLNKQLIIDLFDSIAYSSLDLILEQRAYKSNPESRPNLKGYSLDEMESQLLDKNPNIDSIKKYIHRFKILRSRLLENTRSKNRFINVTDTLLDSKLYRDRILKSKDSIYTSHVKALKNMMTDFQKVFEDLLPEQQWENEKKIELQNKYRAILNREDKRIAGFFNGLKAKSKLLFWLFMASSILNTVLVILLFKKKNMHKNYEGEENVIVPLSSSEKSEKPPKVYLSREKITSVIKGEFVQFKKSFEKEFHKDCIETQETRLKSLESGLLEDYYDRNFEDIDTLKKSIRGFIDAKRTAFEEAIKKYMAKSTAIKEIDKAINAENIIADYSSTLISADEIRIKVNQYKQNYFDELPKVKPISELYQDIANLKKEIKTFIDRRIKENSQLYFPFTDINGIVTNDKKSKERQRDSALKLTLHPDDTSKASFQLLYDYTEMMLGGIQSYDVLLMPICNLKAENFNRNGTRIQQLAEDGEMTLEDGNWLVTKKLDIKII